MNCNKFHKLRPQTCVSTHQNIFPVSENITVSGQMQAVKLHPIHGASQARGLRPHPPPKKKVNGSSLSAEEQFQLFGLRCREDKTGEEVRLFLKEGKQKRPTSGTRPTGSQSKTYLPPLNEQRSMHQPFSAYIDKVVQTTCRKFDIERFLYTEAQLASMEESFLFQRAEYQPVSAYIDEIVQTSRRNFVSAETERLLHTKAQRASMEKRGMSQTEFEAEQDWAHYEGSPHDSNPLKNQQKAHYSLMKLRPQTCVSTHQNIFPVSENITVSGQMQAVKLHPIHGASQARGLRPHPPPKKKVNGSSLSAEEQFQLFGLRPTTESQSKTCLPPLNEQRAMQQPLSANIDEISQTARCNFVTGENERLLDTKAQRASMEEREMSQTELEAEQDCASWTKLEELIDHERKKREEEGSKHSPTDPEMFLSEYEILMNRKEEHNRVLGYYWDQKEKLKKNRVRVEEELQMLTLRIKEMHEKKNQLKADLERNKNIKDPGRITRRTDHEQLYKELAKVTESNGEQSFSTVYPLMILLSYEEWIFDSLDLMEFISTERIRKLQKQICSSDKVREREVERFKRDAYFGERRKRRLERALSQPVKPTGRKLMPRSPPLEKVRKNKKPAETKNMKEDLYAHFLE